MTLTTLILVNAVLGTLIVAGIVRLLSHGIASDRVARKALAEVTELRSADAERLAA
ncbi:MAG TPA: hypothetical protein VMH47_04445 [Gaiellaceae bacterium]|nr:hypothetical protein [Gaiellaceae bacterium]